MSTATDFTTTALIANIRRRAFLPAGQGLTTSDILDYATAELRSTIPAFLKNIREEFLVTSVALPVTSSTIAAPVRAVGAAFRQISWVQPGGSCTFPLDRIEPFHAGQYSVVSGSNPVGFMFQGNNIVLLPPFTTGTILLSYMQRPGELIVPSSAGLITAINTGTGQVTLSAAPTTFTSTSPYDLISSNPNFVTLAIDQTASVSGNVLTFASLPSGLGVGDYIARAGQTPIPQIPPELMDLLAQATAKTIAQAQGSERYGQIQKGLDDLKQQMADLLSPRSDGNARVILRRGGPSRSWYW